MATIRKRQTKDGSFRYKVNIRLKGKPHIYKTFDSLEKAQDFADKMENELKSSSTDLPLPLNDYIDRYLSEGGSSGKNKIKNNCLFKCWKDFLGTSIATQITDREIDLAVLRFSQIPTKFQKPPAKETIRKFIFALSAVYNKAIKEWKWCSINPVSKCSLTKKFRPEPQLVEDDAPDDLLCKFKVSLRKEIEVRTPGMNSLQRAKELGIVKSVYNYLFFKKHNSGIFTILKVLGRLGLTLEIVPIKD